MKLTSKDIDGKETVDWKLSDLIFLRNLGDGLLGKYYLAKLDSKNFKTKSFAVKVIPYLELEETNGYRFSYVRIAQKWPQN